MDDLRKEYDLPPPKVEKTPEEIAAEDMAFLKEQMLALTAIVQEQREQLSYITEPAVEDTEPDFICYKCPGLSRGHFTDAQIQTFNELKAKYPGTKGKRPIQMVAKIRALFIESTHCKAEVCPFYKERPIDELIDWQKKHENKVQIQMLAMKRTKFPPISGI